MAGDQKTSNLLTYSRSELAVERKCAVGKARIYNLAMEFVETPGLHTRYSTMM